MYIYMKACIYIYIYVNVKCKCHLQKIIVRIYGICHSVITCAFASWMYSNKVFSSSGCPSHCSTCRYVNNNVTCTRCDDHFGINPDNKTCGGRNVVYFTDGNAFLDL